MNLFKSKGKREPLVPVLETDKVSTFIGKSTEIKGTMRSAESIKINGKFEGTIEVKADVFIGESANLSANITAKNVKVGGEVHGNIDAANTLEISGTGKVYGDTAYGSLRVEGGIMEGDSNQKPAKAASKVSAKLTTKKGKKQR